MKNLDKFRGCLLGGAAGDALGYAVEFLDESSIFSRYGKSGITAYDCRNGVAEISDDTQMTLFTATGLLLGKTRQMTRGIGGSYTGYIHRSYGDWYRTQLESYPLSGSYHYSWLVNQPEMFARRAPGSTCLSALSGFTPGTMEKPINGSKGCGGVMRVAPIGLYFDGASLPIAEIDRLGAEAAALTHGHSLGFIPAAALVHIIHLVSHSNAITLLDAVEDMERAMTKLFAGDAHLAAFLDVVEKAVALSRMAHTDDLEAIHALGQGWVAEETLAIAIYCSLKYCNDFDHALIAAVNHCGDSDSTGAVTGNILGAYLGLKGIPEKYLERLELRELIIDVADDLFNDCKLEEYSDYRDEVWEKKYVHNTYSMPVK